MAKQLYTQRVSELKRDLEETNAKYSTLTHEIEEIRAGKWDDRLLAKAGHQESTSAPSNTTSPTHDNDTIMQEADTTTTTTTVKAEPMDTATPSINKEQEIKQEPSESTPIATTSESSVIQQPSSAESISEVPQNTSTTEKIVEGTDANAEVPTSIPSPSAISTTQVSLSTSPPKTTTISAAEDHPSPSPKPSSPSQPAEQPIDNTTATQPPTSPKVQQPDGDTRQETANVPSMVLAPTPKEALSAEPHMTTHPTLPVQMEPRPPSGQPGSEDSFHSAEELDAQQPATTTTTSVQETPSSPEKPSSSNVPIEQEDNTTIQSTPVEENVNMNLKRKADEDISGDEQVKRPRMDNQSASVTQPDITEPTISNLVTQESKPTPGESPEEEQQRRHDSPTPSPAAAQTPASNAKSPEAPPSSILADTESVTGSESNAPTPTASTGSIATRKSKDEQRQQKSWQKNINLLWREIANHKNGAVFMNPIKEATAPLYYQIIKHPMDLKAIKNRIREGVSTM